MEFKNQLKEVLIPSVKLMIENEENHLILKECQI
jgi:hypothetical protein